MDTENRDKSSKLKRKADSKNYYGECGNEIDLPNQVRNPPNETAFQHQEVQERIRYSSRRHQPGRIPYRGSVSLKKEIILERLAEKKIYLQWSKNHSNGKDEIEYKCCDPDCPYVLTIKGSLKNLEALEARTSAEILRDVKNFELATLKTGELVELSESGYHTERDHTTARNIYDAKLKGCRSFFMFQSNTTED